MTKRSFFKSIMGAVAAVALAPEIAFGVRLKLAELDEVVQGTDPAFTIATWYGTNRDMFFVFRDGKWVEAGFAGQD